MPNRRDRFLNVLLVDDDPAAALMISRALAHLNCRITHASGGFEAVKELSQGYFDLVILDWIMPDLTGKVTLQKAQHFLFTDPQLKSLWNGRSLPVVSYTSEELCFKDLPDCPQFHFVRHWKKPIGAPELAALAADLFEELKDA